MKLKFCAACGTTNSLEQHHLIPKSMGGKDFENNLITLCSECHGIAHGIKRKANMRELVIDGLKRAKERGVRLGSPEGVDTSPIARAAKSEKARSKAKKIAAIIADIERDGILSLSGIAAALEERNIKTSKGNINWQPTQVDRVLKLVRVQHEN